MSNENYSDLPTGDDYKTHRARLTRAPVVASGFWVGFAMLVIAFWGEPDLHGALITWLESARYD